MEWLPHGNRDLQRNELNEIPAMIFELPNLKTLFLNENPLQRQTFLTLSQFKFLDSQLTEFNADLNTLQEACPGTIMALSTTPTIQTVCVIPDNIKTTANEENGGDGKVTTIVVVVVVLTVVFAIVLMIYIRRHRRQAVHELQHPLNTFHAFRPAPQPTEKTVSLNAREMSIDDPDLIKLQIEYASVIHIRLISHGTFGNVWFGEYRGDPVAIKKLASELPSPQEIKQFVEEIKLMATFNHPKIVQFIGAAWQSPTSLCAVNEFMNCGDLRSILENKALELKWKYPNLSIATDVAEGLVYLHGHNPPFLHRDLKSRNILVDSNMGSKLSDFGLSRRRSYEETLTAGVGTARWIAPEIILAEDYTDRVDIYSFGVVLSELDTRELPFHDAKTSDGRNMVDITILQEVAKGNLRPTFSSTCPSTIHDLAHACLQSDPRLRPSAAEVLAILQTTVFQQIHRNRFNKANQEEGYSYLRI